MQVLIFRGATGIAVWVKRAHPQGKTYDWVCTRDQFIVPAPSTLAQLESTLSAIHAHSLTLAGTLSVITQVDI
jgi:hypothetical protein